MNVTFNPKHGINSKHRKERHFQEEYSLIQNKDGVLRAVMLVRIYGTQSRNYCCLWTFGDKSSSSGSGFAGGYGYHRPSAAVQEALISAGFELTNSEGKKEYIDGRGDSAIEDFMRAVARDVYNLHTDDYLIHKAHA